MLRKIHNYKFGQNGFTLVELIVGLVLIAILTAFLVAALRSASNKLTRITIDKLIKLECAQVTRPIGDGSFNLTVGQIADFGIADLAGPSLTVTKVKIKWEKRRDGCFYTVVITGKKGNSEETVESEESKVPC